MVYTKKELDELQDDFINNKCDRFFLVCKEILSYQIVAFLQKSGYTKISKAKVQQMSHDAATRFIEQYLKKPNYRWNGNVASRLYKEAQFVLYNRHARRADEEVNIDDLAENSHYDPELPTDPIDELDKEDLYHLFTSKTYSESILSISKSKGKKYCYDRAQELRYVYLMLRKGKETL